MNNQRIESFYIEGDILFYEDDEATKIIEHGSKIAERVSGAVLGIFGQEGTGKTCLAKGMAKRMPGNQTIFDATEIRNISEFIKALRLTTQVNIKENVKVVEGQVTALSLNEITLKTIDMESSFVISSQILEGLEKERVNIGDNIKIYKDSGYVEKIELVESSDYMNSNRFEGEILKTQAVTTEMSLDELDLLNHNPRGGNFLYTDQITPIIVHERVDREIRDWIDQEKAAVQNGVCVVTNAHLLNDEILCFLRNPKSKFLPTIILVSNEYEILEDVCFYSFFTKKYDKLKLEFIIRFILEQEKIQIESELFEKVLDVAYDHSLRYALKLLKCSYVKEAPLLSKFIAITTMFINKDSLL